jgi:hypothetical protein
MTDHRYEKAVAVVVLMALVTACSFKTIYNRLDYLIPEYVEGVVTLDDVLEEQLEKRTGVLLHWHRSTQLKHYADWLQALQGDIDAGLTEQQLEMRINEMEVFWLSIASKLNDEMAYLLPLLDAEQQEELFIYLEDSNEEYREAYIELDENERIDGYAERLIDTYENWIGELTDDQLLAVEQAASELVSTAELRLQRRLNWQQGIRQILASNDSHNDKSERLRLFLSGFQKEPEGPVKEATEINRQVMIRLTVRIAHSMAGEQKQYFISKTGDYIRIFTELAENR